MSYTGGARFSLRLGHARALTVHRTVIQHPRAASLPLPYGAPIISAVFVGTGVPDGPFFSPVSEIFASFKFNVTLGCGIDTPKW